MISKEDNLRWLKGQTEEYRSSMNDIRELIVGDMGQRPRRLLHRSSPSLENLSKPSPCYIVSKTPSYFFAGGERLHGGASTRAEPMLRQIGRRVFGAGEGRVKGHPCTSGPKMERGHGDGDRCTRGPHIWRCGATDTCRILIHGARKYL
jgi:hypothetical protein